MLHKGRLNRVLLRWLLMNFMIFTFFTNSVNPSPATATETLTPFDLRDHPIHLIASYYNAISLHDYERAYGYWEGNAPNGQSYVQFAQGFSDVQTVQALARLPLKGGVAAGTHHVDVPIVLLVNLKSGGSQIFAGCFRVTQSNVAVGNPPTFDLNWRLHSAMLQPATSIDFIQATSTCSLVESFPSSDQIENRLYPADLISSYYDAIATHDYTRAYNYWSGGQVPDQTLSQFTQGFANTDNIGVVVALSFRWGVAAGSEYASFPILLTATKQDTPQLFVGCIVTRKSNMSVGDSTNPNPNWYIYDANIFEVSSLDSGKQLIWDICSNP